MEENSYNPKVAKMFNEDPESFEKEVQRYCKKSFEERFVSLNQKSPLRFNEKNNFSDLILEKLLKQNVEVRECFLMEMFRLIIMKEFRILRIGSRII